ncbi:MAG TPA: hypothetical protein VFW19_18460 [Allosphingosinicella sp.]|nr:hypothetical protein [Allosphingosinicella sp.]
MPEPASDPIDGFERIAIVYSQPEAAVLLATLRAYGILALPKNQAHISILPNLMMALGGTWITVPPDRKEDALALMATIDGGWRAPPPPIVDALWLSRIFSVCMTFLLGAPPMPRIPGQYAWPVAPASPERAPLAEQG